MFLKALFVMGVLLAPFVAGFFIHKNYRRMSILLALYLGILLAFCAWMNRVIVAYLPSNIQNLDQAVLQKIIQTHVIKDHGATYFIYEFLTLGLWLYCVVDDVLAFRRRRRAPETDSSDSPKS